MDELKKNIFWIILGVIVIGAIVTWLVLQPDTEGAKKEALTPSTKLRQFAQDGAKPDGLKTANHVKATDEMIKKLEADRKTLMENMEKWTPMSETRVEARYKDNPPPAATKALDFDNWMDAQRKRLRKKLEDAGVQPDANFERDLFAGTGIDADPSDTNVMRHRDYQLRVLNIMEEAVDALAAKTGTMTISEFETDYPDKDHPGKPEPTKQIPAGALALSKFEYHLPKETEDLNKKAYMAALTKNGVYKMPTDPAAGSFKGSEMPVSISSVDIEFVCQLSALPVILKRLEASDKYFAEIAKSDFERYDPKVVPGPVTDTKVQTDYAKAEYKPFMNTHYGEGPIHALVTLYFYEYDKAKAEKLLAPPPAPPRTGPAGTNRPPTAR